MSESDLEDEAIPYQALFLKALSSARSHSQGIGSQPFISSIHPPNAFWTSVEKDLLFHGITRYSRLRPDLIAAHVGGCKTAVDVMAYMASLEQGSKSGNVNERRRPPPGARCVSREWISYEENQAALLVLKEGEWEKSQCTAEREQVLKKARDDLRKRKEKGFVRDVASRDRERERRELWTRQAEEHRHEWDRDDAMDSLGYYELSFLDSLIRSHEESKAVKEEMSPFRETLAEGRSATDPSSRSISEPTAAKPASSLERDASPVDMSAMTPTERRRLQKRLHMRKKRAEAAGKEANTEMARLRPGRKSKYPQSPPATRSPSRARSSQGEEFGAGDRDEGDSEGNQGKKKRNGGPSVAQRIGRQLTELGVDMKTVQDLGLDIFNLARFWSLWDLFADEPEKRIEGISSDTLQLLRACLDKFLHDLIHHTIVLAEEERTMKEHSKVWRGQLNDIKPYHVTEALHMMGKPHLQTKNTLLHQRQLELEGETYLQPLHPSPIAPPWSPQYRNLPQHHELYEPLLYHPSLLLEPDLIEIHDVLIASDDEDLADAKAKAEGMAELAREVAMEEADERLDRRHEAFLWRCAGVIEEEKKKKGGIVEGGEGKGSRRGVKDEVRDEDESMEAESSEEEGEEEAEGYGTDSDDDADADLEVEQILRMGLGRGATRGIQHLRLGAASGGMKSQPFILNSSDDEKGMLTDSD